MSIIAAALLAAPFGPFATPAAPVTRDAQPRPPAHTAAPPPANPFWFAFQVYRLTLSSFDGPKCAHEPTCSLYGYRAVAKHGLLGFFLTADRLLRGGQSSAVRALPQVGRDGVTRFYDPLEENDFWFAR